MNRETEFIFEIENYKVKKLNSEDDVEDLQKLCENCIDYYELLGKTSVDPSAAKELFEDLAPGKKYEDKIMTGIYNEEGSLIGVIEGAMNYPEKNTWYIGLMMIATDHRNIGLGEKFYKGFKRWASIYDVKSIKLGVLEENIRGLKFWGQVGFETIKEIENYKIENIETTVFVMENSL